MSEKNLVISGDAITEGGGKPKLPPLDVNEQEHQAAKVRYPFRGEYYHRAPWAERLCRERQLLKALEDIEVYRKLLVDIYPHSKNLSSIPSEVHSRIECILRCEGLL